MASLVPRRHTTNISLSPADKAWIDCQVGAGEYGAISEYIRHLIRQDLVNSSQAIEQSLLNAGSATPLTKARWQQMHRAARRRLAELQREIKKPRPSRA